MDECLLKQMNQDDVCLKVQIPIKTDEQMRSTKLLLSNPSKPGVYSNCCETDNCIDPKQSKINKPVSNEC